MVPSDQHSSAADGEALVTCMACGAHVLPARHCTVCGRPLSDQNARAGYAASPREPALSVRVISTLFPQLPSADMDAFRTALLLGVGAVTILAALGYYGIALVTGALVIPVLLLVYVYSVDVYEDEPVRFLVLTLGWGLVSGAAYGWALRVLFPPDLNPFAEPDPVTTTIRIVVLPVVATILMLIGPLVLLRYRKFNDVLDGATFGAISGVAFLGAQVVVQSLDLLAAGLQPGGDVWSWVLRILLFGVAVPLVGAGAIGGCCGALWLRYRAPVRDRNRLGLLGAPIVAVVAAALLLVAASAAQELLRDVARLLVVSAIAVVGLLWLRIVIHLGLQQEALEAATAEPQACQECGRSTAPGSFCGECGVALRALPKRAALPDRMGESEGSSTAVATATTDAPVHNQPVRTGPARSLALIVLTLLLSAVLIALIVFVLAPREPAPPCPDPDQQCPLSDVLGAAWSAAAGGPPVHQELSPVLRNGTTWRDADLDWEFDYDPLFWKLTSGPDDAAPALATIETDGIDSLGRLTATAVVRSDASADDMFDRLEDQVRAELEAVEVGSQDRDRMFDPHIGYVPARAGYLVGDSGTTGALAPFGAIVLAASDERLTIGVVILVRKPDTLVRIDPDWRAARLVRTLADRILKRVYWTEDGP
jgi:hypothetical protein